MHVIPEESVPSVQNPAGSSPWERRHAFPAARLDCRLRTESDTMNHVPSEEKKDMENNSQKKICRILVKDEAGTPVKGARVQFCSDFACEMKETDGEGIAVFDCGAGNYSAHIFSLPEGYVKEEIEYPLPETGEISITVRKGEQK